MTDVAHLAKVSQATVSYIINNVAKHSISETTRIAVEKAIEELGYQPNQQARSLASGTSGIVVCVVPPIPLSEPVLRLLGELTAEFARRGLTMTVHFERSGDRTLQTMRSALKPQVVFSLFAAGRRQGMVDLWTRPLPDPGCDLQVDYLAERGHLRLAFVGSPERELARQSGARRGAVQRHAASRGLPDVVVADLPEQPTQRADLVAGWHRTGVTAVCANNDELAFAVLRGIRDAGLRCPQDLSVVGYDATSVGAASDPPLTSVAWNAEAAVPSIVDRVIGLEAGAALQPPDLMDVTILERGSVATIG